MPISYSLFARSLFVTVLAMTYAVSSLAADPPIYSHKRKGAINGADVVAYYDLKSGDKAVLGRDEFSYSWDGALWKFSSAENRQKFIADPQRYVPQYGGYCAFAIGHGRGFTTSIRPDSWKVIDGKLYLNHNSSSFKQFWKDPASSIASADANWPTVLSVCEKRGRCD